jgi:hypothetical protein
MRIMLVAAAAALAALVSEISAAAGHRATSAGHYIVSPDPRACPSPQCGGYWVALANRDRTPCGAGAVRPRCYVASAVARDGGPIDGPIPRGALVRGSIEQRTLDGRPLAVLVFDALRAPVGKLRAAPAYRVRDTGIRCVKAPCFFMRAWLVSTSRVATVSELELGPAGLTPGQLRAAQAALQPGNGGLFLAGRIVPASDGGRSLRATTVYLSR